MFIISLTYTKPLQEIDALLPAHVEYLNAQYQKGHFLASGRKVPRTGGVILARASDKKTLQEIISQDPFHSHQVADYDITEFTPGMTCDELNFLKDK